MTKLSTQAEFDSAFDEGHAIDEGMKKPAVKAAEETAATTDADFSNETDHGEATQQTTAQDQMNQDQMNQDQGGAQRQEEEENEVDWRQRFKSYDGRMKVRENQWEQDKTQWESEREQLERKITELESRPGATAKEETQDTDHGPEFDERAFVEEYGEEVLKAVKHFSKQVATDTVDSRIKPLTEKLPDIEQNQAEIQKSAQQEAGRRFFESVKTEHADFDSFIPGGKLNSDLLEWINAQKSYLVPGYMAVYESGSAEDTKDLLSQYKQARGVSTPQQSIKKSGNQTNQKGSSGLEAVHSRRSPPARGRAGVDDFEGAWDEAERNERR